MNPTDVPDDLLNELAHQCGLLAEYHDVFGQAHPLSPSTRDLLLRAVGVDLDDPEAVAAEVTRRRDAPWIEPLPPTLVLRQGEDTVPLALAASQAPAALRYRVHTEQGETLAGPVDPAQLTEIDRREIHGEQRVRYSLRLPELPAIGYHRLALEAADTSLAEAHLIVTPARCYTPPALQDEGRAWGVAAQLYSVRSERDWGMGDFTDLRALVEACPALGARTVGLNPLHALFPHNPSHDSPYCPSSRLFFNYLYVDVEAIPELAECPALAAEIQSEPYRQQLEQARAAEVVDYDAVAGLKRPLLEQLFFHFDAEHLARDTARAEAFRAYRADRGEDLRLHALYEALQEHLHAQDNDRWGWPVWPEEYRRPDSPAVAAFELEHADRVTFFCWLQWLAEDQLSRISRRADELGLSLGLYLDLSVSVDQAGAEVWANQDMYAAEASVGAPPDALGPLGQDWGLPPLVPERLTRCGYGPFVSTLRQNMRHAGALRIDHAMQLMRLFWIPRGRPAAEGAYMRYPLKDLLGVLALESVRNRCVVIGEDLGTVPDEVRHHMAEAGVLSYRLLIFERRHDGDFTRPADYPRQALVTVTTHDLPTLGAWWEGYDNDLRERLGLFPTEELVAEHRGIRQRERQQLLGALAELGLLPEDAPQDPDALPELPPALARAIMVYLARTPSQLMVVQLEDLLGQVSQANMPSTTHQHPNWKQKLASTLERLAADPEVARTCAALAAERS